MIWSFLTSPMQKRQSSIVVPRYCLVDRTSGTAFRLITSQVYWLEDGLDGEKKMYILGHRRCKYNNVLLAFHDKRKKKKLDWKKYVVLRPRTKLKWTKRLCHSSRSLNYWAVHTIFVSEKSWRGRNVRKDVHYAGRNSKRTWIMYVHSTEG